MMRERGGRRRERYVCGEGGGGEGAGWGAGTGGWGWVGQWVRRWWVELGIGFVDGDGSEVGPFVVVAFVFVFVVDADIGVVVLLVSGLCVVDVGVSIEACVIGVIGVTAIIPMLGIGKHCLYLRHSYQSRLCRLSSFV